MSQYLSGLLSIALGVLLAVSVNAETQDKTRHSDSDCPAAVDVAESMNVNHQGCDYSDKGLNGVLHRALKKNAETKSISSSSVSSAELNAPVAADTAPNKSLKILLTAEIEQWSSAESTRVGLLPKAMAVCSKGFSIISESYKTSASGKIELNLYIQCSE